MKQIGRLPNPDPSDTEPWNPVDEAKQLTIVDPAFEKSRGALRRQAQEWAGLNVDPTAELFVFVGRWSNQKGVDLIADVFPAVLEKNSKVQLICIGPVIDLYGKFAALKLAQIMKKYPGRVYSKPEFTALPPFIFTGAEFALIPSRDEPFGLVAVEFGRKGALGVGARVGGLGQMPGWWFTVESTTTKHLHHQFKKSIEDALASKTEVRALMRARSAKQRFPVAKWVEDLNGIQSKAIKIHQEEVRSIGGCRLRPSSHSPLLLHSRSRSRDVSSERQSMDISEPSLEGTTSIDVSGERSGGLSRTLSLGVRTGPGHRRSLVNQLDSGDLMPGIVESEDNDQNDVDVPGEFTITREEAEAYTRSESTNRAARQLGRNHIRGGSIQNSIHGNMLPQMTVPSQSPNRGRTSSRSPAVPAPLLLSQGRGRSSTPYASPHGSPDFRGRMRSRLEAGSPLPSPPSTPPGLRSTSVLSLAEVTGSRKDYSLQKVDPTFNDTNRKYYSTFEEMIRNLDGKNSEGDLCIEEYLIKSEKEWYKKMRHAKLGRSKDPSPNPSRFGPSRGSSPFASRPATPMSRPSTPYEPVSEYSNDYDEDEFLLGDNYKRESFFKRWMLTRIGDWPIYSLLLALGQIIAANSYQITLLTGGQGETNEKLYIVGGVYIITSCVWWLMFRSFKSVYVLSLPFFFYGLAFLFIGILQFMPVGAPQATMRNAATGMYVIASSSGSLFFALNFGDEGKPTHNLLTSYLSLTYHRRCAHQSLGIPCSRNSRVTADLHHCPLLLGKYDSFIFRSEGRKYHLASSGSYYPTNSRLSLDRRHPSLHFSPVILPPSSWQNPKFLSHSSPSSYHRLVLHHSHSSELLSLHALWSELGISLELDIRTKVVHCDIGPRLLHRHLDPLPSSLWQTEQVPFLDPSHFRYRSRRSSLGADALGNVVARPLAAMDARWVSRRSYSRQDVMALAWSTRFTPGRWIRHDASANSDEDTHCSDLDHRTDPGYGGHDAGQGDCTRQERAG